MSKPTFIFDLDGTLVDVAPFLHHLNGPHKNFDAFHSETNTHGLPTGWVVSLAHDLHAAGLSIIVLTGRPARHRDESAEWLDKHLGVPYELITRPAGDNRSDVAVKRDIYDFLIAEGTEIAGAVDDRPCVLGLWRELELDPLVSFRADWAGVGEHYTDDDLRSWADQEALRRHHGWLPDPA